MYRKKMEQARAQTEQLRIEASITRKKVSEVAKDLIEYCEKEKAGDMLVSGPIDNHNPFQEKKSCDIL
uniref:Guanine nucleotide-binding protein subunit gamma n=1 Tax=Strongyloides stercoralis TaxID=6248 RepID=A0AAF5RSW1_STRER